MNNANESPAWFVAAQKEIGVKEISGPPSNPVIMAYARDSKLSWAYTNDDIPWCAVFVNAMLERQGIDGTRTAWARDFLKWGQKCEPMIGCIIVLSRDGNKGHVGFFGGFSEDGQHVAILGGNQSNEVNWSWYPRGRVLPNGYRWPDVDEEAAEEAQYEANRQEGLRLAKEAEASAKSPDTATFPYPRVLVKERPSFQDAYEHLKHAGSRTIHHSERAEAKAKATIWTSVVAVFASVSTAVSGAYEQISPIVPYVGLGVLAFALALVAAKIMLEQEAIKAARVEDHLTGKHQGR